MTIPKPKQWTILLLIIIPALLAHTLTMRVTHGWGGDFSQYIIQAKSLIDGDIQQVVEYSQFRYQYSDTITLGPLLFPWGFPTLLSPIYAWFGFNIISMKIWVDLFFFLGLVIVFFLFSGKGSKYHNLIIVLILSANPYFFKFKENILSDIPFFFFALFSVFLVQKFILEKEYFHHSITSHLFIGLSIFIAYSIRSIGILLVPTLLFGQILGVRRQYDFSWIWISITPYIVFFSLNWVSRMLLPTSPSYLDVFNLLTLRSIFGNGYYYSKLLADFFSFGLNGSGLVIYLLTIPFMLWGILTDARVTSLYLFFSAILLGLHIFWPARQGLRFIFPLIPFYLHYLLIGINNLKKHLQWKSIDLELIFGITVSFAFILTITFKQWDLLRIPPSEIPGPYHQDSVQLFKFIQDHTEEDSVVVFFKPRVMTLYTGRYSAETLDSTQINECGADYIACQHNSICDSQMAQFWPGITKIFANDHFNLYQFKDYP